MAPEALYACAWEKGDTRDKGRWRGPGNRQRSDRASA